jgi:hypothetical protein
LLAVPQAAFADHHQRSFGCQGAYFLPSRETKMQFSLVTLAMTLCHMDFLVGQRQSRPGDGIAINARK